MFVAKSSDELWVGVKGQSNLVIAGTPRNVLRYSLSVQSCGGRALDGLGLRKGYQTQPNLEYRKMVAGSETTGAKIRGREGNSPDRQLRSPRGC